MSGDDTAQLIYLALLGTAVAGYAVVANQHRFGQMARQAMLWGLIFLGVIAGYGLWQDVSRDLTGSQAVFAEDARVEISRQRDGHYYLTIQANGTPVEFVVDTGATDIVLSRDDALRLGIDLDNLVYSGIAQTANGTVRSARAKIETMDLGGIIDHNVTVWVNEGDLFSSLLGMAYLQRFDRIEIQDNRMVLHR